MSHSSLDKPAEGNNISDGEVSFPLRLLTAADIARILAISKSLIYKWVEEQVIPHYRLGKAIRFDLSEIKEWLKTKSIDPIPASDSTHENNEASSSSGNIHSKPNENLMRDVDRILKSTSIRDDV